MILLHDTYPLLYTYNVYIITLTILTTINQDNDPCRFYILYSLHYCW